MTPKLWSTYRVVNCGALGKSLNVSDESVMLGKIKGRIDKTATSGTYYLQFLKASALPSNGPVTHLMDPEVFDHVSGVNTSFSFDFSPNYIKSSSGLFLVLSTTEFIKTIVTSDILSCTAFTVV